MLTDVHPASYYRASVQLPDPLPVLNGVVEADVCIVGGGFTGINTAIELAERGFSVVVLEGQRIGWGASGRNGGQLIRGVGHDLSQFQSVLGDDGVNQLYRLGLTAVDIVKQRIEQHHIACDLRWGYADLADRPQHMHSFAAERDALLSAGYNAPLRLIEKAGLADVVGSDVYLGALVDEGSGHLHPLKLILGEAAVAQGLGVRCYEHSPALEVHGGEKPFVRTALGRVNAKTVVVACNAYIGQLQPYLSHRVLPAGSYIIATERLSDAQQAQLIPHNRALCDQRIALDYFRLSADGRLLFGGACHYSGRDPQDISAYMRPKMLRVYPQLADVKIDYAWGGMIGIGMNRLPQIGRLKHEPNLYYAQAYAGHGLNATHLAAQLLAQTIAGQHSHGFDLFASVPHHAFPGGQLLRAPMLALGMLWLRFLEWKG